MEIEMLEATTASDTTDHMLLDIEMPDISGMELAEQIFSSHINTNIIFVTNRR